MHIPESAYSANEFSSPATVVFVAEITCILCAREVGIAVDRRWPPVGTVLIQPVGSKILSRVELHRLRCPDCGGNTSTEEVTIRLLRRERPIDWKREERPRRGRPPKWFVEQRRAAGMSDRDTA